MSGETPHKTERILIISDQVTSPEGLHRAAKLGTATVHLNYHTDKLETLIKKVRDAAGDSVGALTSIGIMSHGEPNQFSLREDLNVHLNSLSSSQELQRFFRGVGTLVRQGGRLDLLACCLAQESGENNPLILELEKLTGLNVTASTDATGPAAHGGNWILETDGIDVEKEYFDPMSLGDWNGEVLGDDGDWEEGGGHRVGVERADSESSEACITLCLLAIVVGLFFAFWGLVLVVLLLGFMIFGLAKVFSCTEYGYNFHKWLVYSNPVTKFFTQSMPHKFCDFGAKMCRCCSSFFDRSRWDSCADAVCCCFFNCCHVTGRRRRAATERRQAIKQHQLEAQAARKARLENCEKLTLEFTTEEEPGKTQTVSVPAEETIQVLMEHVAEKLDLPKEAGRLMEMKFADEVLSDCDGTLVAAGFANGAKLKVTVGDAGDRVKRAKEKPSLCDLMTAPPPQWREDFELVCTCLPERMMTDRLTGPELLHDKSDLSSRIPWDWAVRKQGDSEEIMKVMLEAGFDINTPLVYEENEHLTTPFSTALHVFVKKGNPRGVEMLLKFPKLDLHAEDADGFTPLQVLNGGPPETRGEIEKLITNAIDRKKASEPEVAIDVGALKAP